MGNERDQKGLDITEIAPALQNAACEFVVRGGRMDVVRKYITAVMALRMTYRAQGVPPVGLREYDLEYDEENNIFFVGLPWAWLYIPKSWGGAGWMPQTVFCESKDRVVYLAMNEYVRKWATFLRTRISSRSWLRTRSQKLSEVLPGIEAGKSYISALLDGTRIRTSSAALELLSQRYPGSFNPRDQYSNYPTRMVDQLAGTILSTKNLRDKMRYQFIKALATPGKVRVKLDKELGWLDYVSVVETDELVDPLISYGCVTPIATSDPITKVLVRALGPGAASASSFAVLRDLEIILDRQFPNDMKKSDIIKRLMSSRHRGDSIWVANFLIAMGADAVMAHEISGKLTSFGINPLLAQSVMGYTLADPFLALINQSIEDMPRVVDVQEGLNGSATVALLVVGFMWFVVHGSGRRVKVRWTEELSELLKGEDSVF